MPRGQIRRPLALQVGKEEQAVGAGRDGADGFLQLRVGPAEKIARGLGRHGDVHRADQRQPRVGAVAEAGDFAPGIDDRLLAVGVDRARGAEAGRDAARRDVARADRAHHVVAAARADDDVRRADSSAWPVRA